MEEDRGSLTDPTSVVSPRRPRPDQREEGKADHSTTDVQQAEPPPSAYQSFDSAPVSCQATTQVRHSGGLEPHSGNAVSGDGSALLTQGSSGLSEGSSAPSAHKNGGSGKGVDEKPGNDGEEQRSVPTNTVRTHPGSGNNSDTRQPDALPDHNAVNESPDRGPPPPPPTPAEANSPGRGKFLAKLPSFSKLASSIKYSSLREVSDQPGGPDASQSDDEQKENFENNLGSPTQVTSKSSSKSPADVTDTSQRNDVMTGGSNRSLEASRSKLDSGLYQEHAHSDNNLHEESSCYSTCLPVRYMVVCMVFLGMMIINAMRTNVGVMVLTILDKENHRVHNDTGDLREVPSVDWDTMMIGFLHAIFYVGYMVTNLPGAYLTTRLPSHTLFGGCILVSCLLNLTLPVAIELAGYGVTITIRFVQGLSEGLLYPACYGILRHWSTPPERGRLGSLVFTGAYLGPVIGFPLAGVITDFVGWQYSYYFNGGLGIIYVFVWAWISEEKPSHHKFMSPGELSFIEEMQGSERIDYEGMKIPWGSILTSLPVASLCLCHFARNWVFILMLTNEPFFLNIFHFTIAQNGVYSALPHVIKVFASFISGYIADFLLSHKLLNTTHTRKILTSGFGVQALFFVLLTQTTDGAVSVIFLTLALGFGGLVVSGWQLNHYDLSARHASVLVGVTSTLGNMGSIAAPLVAGALTEDKNHASWSEVWYITAGITGFACLSYLAFGSGERQSWSVPADTSRLVIKEDKRRRRPTSDHKPTSAGPTFIFSKLREGADKDHVVTGHVPNYGSQQTTPRGEISGADDTTKAKQSDVS